MSEEKTYTISEVAEMLCIPPSTIRYYDSQGLLPWLKRTNGRRIFSDSDIGTLKLIECLKNTGMSIHDIKEYFVLAKQGDSTLVERKALILKQKQAILDRIEHLKLYLKTIEHKEQYYKEAIEAGTEAIHHKKK
jgi:DNA-binding transcriptional MerR regulator